MQINRALIGWIGIIAAAFLAGAFIDWGSVMSGMQDLQRAFHDRIASDMRVLHEGGSATAIFTLMAAGFLYGVFHAVGPGHGKLLITGYMLADEHTLKRGILITGLSSLLQSVIAIVLVLGLFYGLGLARSQTEYAASVFESASFGLVAVIGGLLMVRGVRGAGHQHSADCGHVPDARQVAHVHGIKGIGLMIFSIGIRPCSGALLMMFFACLLKEVAAGIAATMAMGLGTAITTGTIAIAAAHSRKGLLKLVGSSEKRLAVLSTGLKIVGGFVILVLGVLMLYASLPQQQAIVPYNHPLMNHR